MATPERFENAKSTREPSGIYLRATDETTNLADPDSLESLVRRASSRPPSRSDESGEFPASIFGKRDELTLDGFLEASRARPRTIVPPAEASSLADLPMRVKWLIVVPWSLLAIVTCGFAIAWPHPGSRAAGESQEPVYALAPIPAGADRADATVAVDVAPTQVPDLVFGDDVLLPVASTNPSPVAVSPTDSAAIAVVDAAVAPAVVAEEAAVLLESVTTVDLAAPAPTIVSSDLAPPTDPGVLATAAQIRAQVDPASAAAPAVATASAPVVLTAHPSRAEVARALRAVHGAVDACTADVGVATIRLTVANDGSVSAAMATGTYAGTPEGACMADAVRRARFSAFTESSLTVTFPFTLR